LEHPAHSSLWIHCGLPRPGELPDQFGGVTVEVQQCRWGHVAEKLTWLYLVGINPALVHRMPYIEPVAVVKNTRGPGRRRLPEMRKSQRHITPSAFAEMLVGLARSVPEK
jgi:hypothetical protein